MDQFSEMLSEWRQNVGAVIEGNDPLVDKEDHSQPRLVKMRDLLQALGADEQCFRNYPLRAEFQTQVAWRFAVWYIAKTMMCYSQARIARVTGYDRTTIIHALMAVDAALATKVPDQKQTAILLMVARVMSAYRKAESGN